MSGVLNHLGLPATDSNGAVLPIAKPGQGVGSYSIAFTPNGVQITWSLPRDAIREDGSFQVELPIESSERFACDIIGAGRLARIAKEKAESERII